MVPTRAEFSVADDLLREAAHSRLANHGTINVEKSGRIGPVIELAFGSIQFADQYHSVSVSGAFSHRLRSALQTGQPFGSGLNDCAGAFPLGEINPITSDGAAWDQWTLHAENIAKTKGLNAHLVASLIGAMVELQDNVYEHSNAPRTGLVAYAVTASSFEFVVADRGIGVLRTLRQNPVYAGLPDAGAALKEMVKEGVSRFPVEAGRGQGFNQLFRALVGHKAELRFRSGDHALSMIPTSDGINGATALAQVAQLEGLAISVFCRSEVS